MLAFVILHYKTIDETLKCLECLQKTFSKTKYYAIVVDNNTLLEEHEKKIRKYTDDIIKLKENMGFAKANNIGVKYAFDKYQPDFIAVINNDVFITQKDFYKIVIDDYNKYKFDMLGPWIDSTTNESCNPFPVIYGEENIISSIKKSKKLIKIYNSFILYLLLECYLNLKKCFIAYPQPTNGNEIQENIPLHGCAIIFSKKYCNKYKDAFYNGTFLFHEEEFLYHRVVKDKVKSLYDPKLKVFHKEGASVKKDNKSIRKSKIFRHTEKIKSLELLLEQLKK